MWNRNWYFHPSIASLTQTRFFASAVKHRLFSPAFNKREFEEEDSKFPSLGRAPLCVCVSEYPGDRPFGPDPWKARVPNQPFDRLQSQSSLQNFFHGFWLCSLITPVSSKNLCRSFATLLMSMALGTLKTFAKTKKYEENKIHTILLA